MLRETKGWPAWPFQWAVAGYRGAIGSGRAICGSLFAGTVYLGYLQGAGSAGDLLVDDDRRRRAMDAVGALYEGLVRRFGHTDCLALTGCNFGVQADRERYWRDKVYEAKCLTYCGYVLATCLGPGSDD